MKRILKYAGYCLLGLLVLVLLYCLAGWVLSRIPVSAEKDTSPDVTIYLRTNGVHTDMVLPVHTEEKDWSQQILYRSTRQATNALPYLAFGWGSEEFYIKTPNWSDLTFGTAFRAAFGLGSAAYHASFCSQPRVGASCVQLEISHAQYQRLIRFIEDYWQADSTGAPIVIAPGYGDNDVFYKAKGNYHLFHTCNTWTNDALKAFGQKACWWTPFDGGIFYQYRGRDTSLRSKTNGGKF